jgi:hypothetical protein
VKPFICVVALLIGTSLFGQTPSQGDHKVRQYEKKNGTVVAPHYQTNPNSTQKDNYSATGRTNPHTGKQGTKPPKPLRLKSARCLPGRLSVTAADSQPKARNNTNRSTAG